MRLHESVTSTKDESSALPAALPRHVAIIMDGNGRWAKRRGLGRSDGHRAGAESVRAIVRMARRAGIGTLTLYAFSEQNWSRPATEVQGLFSLLVDFLASERDELRRHEIRLVAIGHTDKLPLPARLALRKVVDDTRAHTAMTLALCLSYGGREDLVQAARSLAEQVRAGTLDPATIDESTLARSLWTARLGGDPDLVIRTSGEQRLSNFLLWESAYAELVFSDVDWPDFREAEFLAALQAFAGRQRRFGAVAA
ncbi:MAG: di-trans,poly-cis-decaprenylcistransferase [Deltaproteobacteria bacterium]|nr:di-trans,poly-cis-decaprenylcistransferase [Deltaproteobacteria bacterium]